ncbi:MAG: hypothetical protein IIA33_04555 [Planctomycetes bacterium]|nr:hypothetical protein [Planctomycetota bacterium]
MIMHLPNAPVAATARLDPSCALAQEPPTDTPGETFAELPRPDGRPWTLDFAPQRLDLVTIQTDGSPDFYSVERSLRFDHLDRPSRNALFSLVAENQTLAVTITTTREVRWSLDATP